MTTVIPVKTTPNSFRDWRTQSNTFFGINMFTTDYNQVPVGETPVKKSLVYTVMDIFFLLGNFTVGRNQMTKKKWWCSLFNGDLCVGSKNWSHYYYF